MTILRHLAFAMAALLGLAGANPAWAQDQPEIVGTWHGTLQTPRGSVILILYVTQGEDGALKAQVENANQAPGQMADVTSIAVNDGHLSWKIDRIGASFEGDWAAGVQEWQGTFNQGLELPLAFAQGLPPPLPVIEGLDGRWEGTATLNSATLRQVLRIDTGERGTVMLYDSPDQMASGIPVENFARDGQAVRFSVMSGVSTFNGTLSDDMTQLAGTFTTSVNDNVVQVTLTRAQEEAERKPPNRPQTPHEPFPYAVEEVAFDNPVQAGVHLAGSLTLPQGKGPFPAAVLITGSGAQDRDETLLGHKPFAVIADHLTRHGIAVLRYDDRGVGKSIGDYAAATSADLATDANAAATYLASRPDIRHDAIGFIGHSEGGMIGPIAMADNDKAAFLVMLAGPGTALDKLMLSQRRLIGSQMGLSEQDLDRAEPVMAAVFRAIADADTPEAGKAAARAVLTPEALAQIGLPAGTGPDIVVNQVTGPWFSYFLKYDPAPNLARITVPVLALNGSLDRQVPPQENLAAIRAATAGNPDVTIVELPGLNHLFQTAMTGGVGEYADIEETVAPVALDTMTEWLVQRFVSK